MTKNNTVLSQDMKDLVRSVRGRGGKVYLAKPDDGGVGCTNCNGSGTIALQVVTGGPFESPPTSKGTGSTLIWEGGSWFLVKTRPFTCPVCRGHRPNSRPATPDPERARTLFGQARERVKAGSR